MAVNLTKGQKVDLTKGNSGLKSIVIGLGWDEAKPVKSGLFGKKKTQNIDCDASVFVLTNGKLAATKDVVYYGNLKHSSGGIVHQGDNLTGAGTGDCEQIMVELDKVPATCDRLIFVVNIYQAFQRNQHFGMVENAFIRIFNSRDRQELCRYNLSGAYDGTTAMIFGEVYRHGGEWKFNAIGEATRDEDLTNLAKRFM